ncbi:MAG: tRNA (N6-threonylcarbamoyladenosine(37)-N6)-methyltransferase TrmO [Ignavibacteria bacterium]|nr:tRNA (N6-threonylcarbamoyladenosine(37)-N6)-methyltransferase TrmO [Ignavibacteria bacterium]
MYSIEPIAFVKNDRSKVEDDFWGDVISEIIISDKISEDSIKGIEEFSHLEIIFYFHLADLAKINISATHPRNNKNFPKVGIFSQRKKARPNLLGTTIVRLREVKKNILIVEGLDAVDGTPVIDIKPVVKEFLPKENVSQPGWTSELMKDYWSRKS